jgi:adenosylhomocysteine nucleosidase
LKIEMRILVTFAVEAEFAPWRKLRSFQKLREEQTDYFTSDLEGSRVDVLLTGVGGRKPWVEVAGSLYESEIQLCISSGLAGGLRSEHLIGEILVAEKVLAAPRDTSAFSEPSMIDVAVKSGAKKVGSFYTADRVVLTAVEKRELGAIADAVEMESFTVLIEAGMFAEKMVAIRAISDTVDEDLPLDFNRVTDQSGDVSVARILGQIAGSPTMVPELVRFGQRSKSAAESLAAFLERYVLTLVRSHASEFDGVRI